MRKTKLVLVSFLKNSPQSFYLNLITKSYLTLTTILIIKAFQDALELMELVGKEIQPLLNQETYTPKQEDCLSEDLKTMHKRKNNHIKIRLSETYYELDILKSNFERLISKFKRITNTEVLEKKLEINNTQQTTTTMTPIRGKRSVFESIFKFLFGGSGGTDEAVKQLEQNVNTLWENSKLHQEQIEQVFKASNLNQKEIMISRKLIRKLMGISYKLNNLVVHINREMRILMVQINFQLTIFQIHHRINLIRDVLFGLNIDLENLYELFDGLSTLTLTPRMITPRDLINLLQMVQEEIRSHPKLKLPIQVTNQTIYKYYRILKFHM